MKYIIKTAAILLAVMFVAIFASCTTDPLDSELFYSEIINADTYINYAEEVKFDYEVHPELVDNGLFWMMYDEEEGKVIGVNVNDTERVEELGTALVDPDKPTIINLHGVQLETYMWTDAFSSIYDANTTVLPPEVYGYQGIVNMNRIWLDRGYNVMCYMYHRFADENMFGKNGIVSNKIIEAKIWSINGPQKMSYRLQDGSFSAVYESDGSLDGTAKYPELEYSLAEYFVGDYIRALNSVEGLADNEIRITCHSMGCTLELAGTTLLGELVRTKQIDASYLPDRIALLDGYLGVVATDNEQTNRMFTNNDITVRWTNKATPFDGTSALYLDCVKQLVTNFDMPIEFYIDNNGVVPQVSGPWFTKVKKYCANTYYDLEFPGSDHNAVRELYHASYMSDNPPLDITEDGVTAYALSARSSIETIKACRGHEYLLVEGNSSGNAADHRFIRIK